MTELSFSIGTFGAKSEKYFLRKSHWWRKFAISFISDIIWENSHVQVTKRRDYLALAALLAVDFWSNDRNPYTSILVVPKFHSIRYIRVFLLDLLNKVFDWPLVWQYDTQNCINWICKLKSLTLIWQSFTIQIFDYQWNMCLSMIWWCLYFAHEKDWCRFQKIGMFRKIPEICIRKVRGLFPCF